MDITAIIEAVFGLLAAIVTAVLIPWLTRKLGAANAERLSYWVSVGVKAAEQIYKGFTKAGKDKKDYVKAFLEQNGITYDDKKIDGMIEAAVLELTNK